MFPEGAHISTHSQVSGLPTTAPRQDRPPASPARVPERTHGYFPSFMWPQATVPIPSHVPHVAIARRLSALQPGFGSS